MGRFTVIPQNTFEGLQMDAGVLLNRFDPTEPAAPADEDIICATTGGITISCKPTYSDLGEDVDNCPNNMMELKHLDGWDCMVKLTSLGTSVESIRLSLGAADINAETGAIKPRKDLKQEDFADLWWVGDRADGGCVAVQIKNALSTAGFELKTEKSGKGQVGMELTGHVSLNDQETMPMVFYSMDPSVEVYSITQNLTNVSSSFAGESIGAGGNFVAFLTADEGYTLDTPTVTMGNEAVTDAWNADQGSVTISNVDGDIVLTATATEV